MTERKPVPLVLDTETTIVHNYLDMAMEHFWDSEPKPGEIKELEKEASLIRSFQDDELRMAEQELKERLKTDDMSVKHWRERAVCIDMDPDDFFPESGTKKEGAEIKKRREQRALGACAACEIRKECFKEAITKVSDEDHGIWGGTTEKQRTIIRKHRRRLRGEIFELDPRDIIKIIKEL